jgi:hypothetical protein
VNEDGHPDIVTAARSSVAVLLNQQVGPSWGSFQAPLLYPTPSSWGVAVADYNGDGHLDIAAGNWLDPDVDLFFGLGNGTFVLGSRIAVPGGCADIVTADLNQDRIADLAVPGGGGIWVLLGNGSNGHGDGTFSLASYDDAHYHYFNGLVVTDGNIVATDNTCGCAAFLPGRGDGTFLPAANFPVERGPTGLTTLDANRDGLADLVVACSSPGRVDLLLGDCPTAFEISMVRDVPNDHGGYVFVGWQHHPLDAEGQRAIQGYRVWRRALTAPSAPLSGRNGGGPGESPGWIARSRVASDGRTLIEYWEPLTTVPAAYLPGYACTAPTLQDAAGPERRYTAFFVQALTEDPFTFYSTPVDSGYSVNNLSPTAHTVFPNPEPSPAALQSTLRYRLDSTGEVRLRIYDVTGRLVRRIVDTMRSAGDHTEVWDLRDEQGRPVATGLYFARLEIGPSALQRRIMVIH